MVFSLHLLLVLLHLILHQGHVQLYLLSASWALHVLLKPPPEAVEMEDVSTTQFFGFLDFLEADDAGVVHAAEIFLRHVGQSLQLVDEAAGLNEELDRLAQAHYVVDDLAQQVERELLPGDDVEEELQVQQQHHHVEHEAYYVEYESLFSPLFSVVELYQADSVLEAVLNRFQEQSEELHSTL